MEPWVYLMGPDPYRAHSKPTASIRERGHHFLLMVPTSVAYILIRLMISNK